MTGVVDPTATSVSAVLREIQVPVRERLDRVALEMQDIATAELPLMREVASHLLRMRGKMFRPTLALLSSAVEGAPEDRSITLGATIELMHLASLVHDDSVDHSVLRRGLPTVNSLFSHQISVIMGDFLYARALGALVRLGDLTILQILTDVTGELTTGEMREFAAIDRLGVSEDEYYEVIRAKTASLIRAACEAGSLCGAVRHRSALARYGDRLGMVFQIADDILDYTEDESVTGKPGGLDLKEHKVTLPLILALPNLSPAGRRTVDALFANESPDSSQVAEAIAAVRDAGGVEAARGRTTRFAEEAEAALQQLPASPHRTALVDAITYVMERRS
jgi:octaprenyl-diphosphate synthase